MAFLALQAGSASAQYISRVAGNGVVGHGGDGEYATNASFRCPSDIAVDTGSNLFIADGGPFGYQNDAVIRRVDAATGIVTRFAGVPWADSAGTDGDGIPAITARLTGCAGICFDPTGNLLITDGISRIRKIDIKTGIITTIAGSNVKGKTGDNGPATAALLNGPEDITTDAAGNIYFSDVNNHVIRRIDGITNNISLFAGRYAQGYSGDGGIPTGAKFSHPHGICFDNSGNFYIADYDNNAIRVISGGTISTLAGGNGPGYAGDGGHIDTAKFAQPARLVVDNSGNLFVTDMANRRVRKIVLSAGTISNYAGNGFVSSEPDSILYRGPATGIPFAPYGLCVDECGDLLIGTVLFTVRAVTPSAPAGGYICNLWTNAVTDATTINGNLTVFPNPGSGHFTVRLASPASESVELTLIDVTGRQVAHTAARTNTDISLDAQVAPGLYMLRAETPTGTQVARISVQ